MQKYYMIIAAFILCVFGQPLVEAGVPTAIDVADEAKNTGANLNAAAHSAEAAMQAAFERVAAKEAVKQALEALQEVLATAEKAQQEVGRAQANVKEKDAYVGEAAKQVAEAEGKERAAINRLTLALAAQTAAQERAAGYWRIAEQTANSVAQSANETDEPMSFADINEGNIDEIAGRADQRARRDNAKLELVAAARDRAETFQQEVDAAGENTEIAQAGKDAATDEKEQALDRLTDAKIALEDAEAVLKDAQRNLEDAKAVVRDAKAELDSRQSYVTLLNKEDAKIPIARSVLAASTYYSWKDNRGDQGHQFVSPYSFFYQHGNWETSFNTAYVISQHAAPQLTGSGRVSGWSDSDVAIAHTNGHGKYSVRYSLDVNMPTGKAALSGEKPIMNDDLVKYGTFGSGWNYTPGVAVSRKVSDKDTWTLATTYSFQGDYTLLNDVPNNRLSPGNIWTKTFQWQHLAPNWRLLGELSHVDYTDTQVGGADYVRDGDQLDTKLTYVKDLSHGQSLLLYYWNSHQQPDQSLAQQAGGSSRRGQYSGLMWSKPVQVGHTMRYSFDFMNKSGEAYDILTDSIFHNGKKYTGGIGYDVNISEKQTLSFDVQKIFMKNDPNVNYHGYNIMVKYSRNY
ncbi:coiled-coil domain-containing protein [Propionispora hippei]|uniref:Uncharacterized protein n=1 Tax=Propionispora hippei DSM 15287 TaxID=1123003 RepID=A0A1M6G9Q0_9FIRM|nr:hypothetical protein [Propionispora hippei]SHJ06659.1 hypothetical protein SAMN02745170_01678 [Propionispora hippei DSM 15287]